MRHFPRGERAWSRLSGFFSVRWKRINLTPFFAGGYERVKLMKKTWYHRMLLSYLPIYFFITSIIILMTFLMISNLARREAVNANQMYVEQQVQVLDKSLRSIDDMLIKELQYEEKITQFFTNRMDSSYMQGYEISEKINQLKSKDPLIDSIYLYRFSDSVVMTPNMMISVDRFADREFADSFRNISRLYTLSDQRIYMEFLDQPYPVTVISIVRKYPLLGGEQGIVAVNISVPKLQRWLEDISRSERSFLYIVNGQGGTIHPAGSLNKGTELSRIKSDYTGWEFVGGVRDGHLFQFASLLSYIWIICGLIVVGFLWIMFITKRNYKPIETIMDRIHHYSVQKSSKLTLEKDEFKFIDQALESLIEKSQTYQKLHEEDLDIRRRQLLYDLLEGNRTFSEEAWRQEALSYQLPEQYSRIAAAVLEIDRFVQWNTKYNLKDQYLLKFVLTSVVKEVAEGGAARVWSEWTGNHRLAVVYFLNGEGQEDTPRALAEQVRAWVETNLDFTVTAGLSETDTAIASLAQLYDQACDALSYKNTIGMNRVLTPPYRKEQGEPYKHIQNIRNLTQSYRLLEPKWQEMYGVLFTDIRQDLLTREELLNLLNYMAYQLNKEMSALAPEIVESWSAESFPRLTDAIEEFDVIDEPQERILEILMKQEQWIVKSRENRSSSVMARNIRHYIEANLSNPDLSLNHLCDEFGLNGKYISRMFKEEFGEKLVDYMVSVRVNKSKELLRTTAMSVQEVALAVGYIHDISFIRTFKKIVGQTPGEFRKGG
jgi:YesN/AraC family two-component response regulator